MTEHRSTRPGPSSPEAEQQILALYRTLTRDQRKAPEGQQCRARTVFWPDDEACDAECILPRGHGGTVHEDEILGEWDENEMTTIHPE